MAPGYNALINVSTNGLVVSSNATGQSVLSGTGSVTFLSGGGSGTIAGGVGALYFIGGSGADTASGGLGTATFGRVRQGRQLQQSGRRRGRHRRGLAAVQRHRAARQHVQRVRRGPGDDRDPNSVAPGAQYYLYDSGTSLDSFAVAATALLAAGCKVIVDDISISNESLYQTGSSLDNAITAAVAKGSDYFTSAGNSGNDFYENGFKALNATIDNTGAVVASATDNNVGGDALQNLDFTNSTANTAFRVVVVQNGGTVPAGQLFKLVLNSGQGTINDPNANKGSGALTGHEALLGENVLASVDVANTPVFGNAAVIETSSSVGPGKLLYDGSGNLLATAIVPNEPQFAAPDGTNTNSSNGKGGFGLTPFFGTSAAAPAAGAATALVLQVNGSLSTTQVTWCWRSR